MSLAFDLFWSFRSPYSYLATPRIVEIAATYDVTVHVRPVYPLAVRVDGFFDRQHPLWFSYLARDTFRIAQMEGIPYGPPRPDPIVQNILTREIAKEQPYIWRLTRLGQAAAEAGKGLAFIAEVSRLIWGGDVAGWNEGEHLAQAAARAGCDLAELDARVAAEGDRLHADIEANQKALEAAGHWGVPTMVFEHEAFFGQDRIATLLWRMQSRGLRARA